MRSSEQFAEDALAFEQATSAMAKSPDCAESFERYHGVMKHVLIAAGETLCQPFPHVVNFRLRPGQMIQVPERCTPRVAFFMPTATLLAHSRNLLTYLDALQEFGAGHDKGDPLGQRGVQPFVYTFANGGQECAEFDDAYRHHTVRHLGGANSLLGLWQRLRQQAIEDELDAIVFVSVVQGLAFASTFRPAPKVIWWAHKWHGLELPALDGYIDACHPFVDGPLEIGGKVWRSTYTALPDLFDASKTEEARQIRAGLEVETVFGWMGREDKITAEYLEAVCEILRQVPDSIYVYTGREDRLAECFASQGLTDRVAFIGWIDTALWAQVIDVYIDTFPFQSGHSAYAMMAASRPVVWLHDEATAKEQSASGLIVDTWEQGARELYRIEPWCASVLDYVSVAVECAEPESRNDLGQRNRRWLERFMMDRRRMAESVTRAILEIVES